MEDQEFLRLAARVMEDRSMEPRRRAEVLSRLANYYRTSWVVGDKGADDHEFVDFDDDPHPWLRIRI